MNAPSPEPRDPRLSGPGRRTATWRTPLAVPASRPPVARPWRWFEALAQALAPPPTSPPPAEADGKAPGAPEPAPIDARELSPWSPFSMRF